MIPVAGRFNRRPLTALEAKYAHQFVWPEIEDHLRNAQFLMVAAVYMPGGMQTEQTSRLLHYVRTKNIAELPCLDRVAADRDHLEFAHTLFNQSIAATKCPCTFTDQKHGADQGNGYDRLKKK